MSGKPLTKTRLFVLCLLGAFVLALSGYVCERLIKTDREHILALIDKASDAAIRKDFDVMNEIVSDRYHGTYAPDKSSLIARAKRELADVEIESIKLQNVSIELENKSLAMVLLEFEARGFVTTDVYNRLPFRGFSGSGSFDRATFVCAKEGKHWRVTYFELVLEGR